MKKAKLRVFRFNPDEDKAPRYQLYEIPCEEFTTVLMALKYIYENLDNTLAFRNYCCGTMRCLGCVVNINGKSARACSTLILPGEEITVEPVSKSAVIRDLVVNFKANVATPSFKDLYWNVIQSGKCNACGACVAACPYGLINLKDNKPVLSALMRQDWCPLGDTLECGKCAGICPVLNSI